MEAIPLMNRSAKDGARSSLQFGGEGVPIHPSHQGVCGRHGMEGSCVTHGGLVLSVTSVRQAIRQTRNACLSGARSRRAK